MTVLYPLKNQRENIIDWKIAQKLDFLMVLMTNIVIDF